MLQERPLRQRASIAVGCLEVDVDNFCQPVV